MKEITKSILALAMLMVGATSVNAAVKTYEFDQKLTGVSSLDGKLFAIVNETDNKVFYGKENQNVGYDTYDKAFVESNSFIQFRLVAAVGEGLDGCYYLQSVKADGTDYTFNGGGYLNTASWCVFVMGLNGQNGQDFENGAVWQIAYDEGNSGFTIKNKYYGNYLKDAGAANNANPTYFSFYTLKEYVSTDPLANEKADLSELIAKAKIYNTLAYTDASFAALTTQISTAEGALVDAEATSESLTTAKNDLQGKIDALALKDDYSLLTTDMFKHWDSATAPTSGSATGCADNLFVSSDMPYGDSGVGYLNYADLSNYDQMIIIAEEGTPRVMMNRIVDGGSYSDTEAESKMIEMPKDGKWTDRYYSKEGKIYTYNLALMKQEKGFAHLNAVKIVGWGNKGVMAGIYLYKSPDPLASYKEVLTAKIQLGKAQNAIGKTTASFGALTTAISDGETALADAGATQSSLEGATQDIQDAIDGLKLAAGFAKVAKNMFMVWDGDGADAKATGVSPAGVNNIGVANAGVPYGYGSGNVYWNHYVDLTPYETLYAAGTKNVRARYLFNRPMDSENPSSEGTAAFIQKYVTVDENGVAELALSDVSTEFVHLNTFKAPDGGTFTDFLVYAAKTKVAVGEAGYATMSSVMNVDMTGVKAYVAKVNGSYLTLTEVTEVPANTAVIVKAAKGEYNLTNIETAAAVGDNDLKISDGSVTGDKIYVLAKPEDKEAGFYKLDSSKKVPAGKAYIELPATAPALEFIGFNMETTGINDVRSKMADVRGDFFDLQGRKVANPTKGLYIVNGKKVAIK